MPMPKIKSTQIIGSKPEAETIRKIQEQGNIPIGVPINLMIFEVDFDKKKFYCCWSGGEFRDNQPHCTLIGQAAMEALANLPMGDQTSFIFQELKLGQTPLKEKIKATLKKAPPNAKICFIGDMSGDLDGHMHSAFNVIEGEVINVAH